MTNFSALRVPAPVILLPHLLHLEEEKSCNRSFIYSFLQYYWVPTLYQHWCRCWWNSDGWDWPDPCLQGADGPCHRSHSRLPGARHLLPSQHTRGRTDPRSSSLSHRYSLTSLGELHRHCLLNPAGHNWRWSPWQHSNGQLVSNLHIRHVGVVQIR